MSFLKSDFRFLKGNIDRAQTGANTSRRTAHGVCLLLSAATELGLIAAGVQRELAAARGTA